MTRSSLIAATVLTVFLAASIPLAAQESSQIRNRDIYGSQLMTTQERNEYRARMRAAKTREERERIRAENHERMKERAKEHGVVLPDAPPRRGPGMSPGPGMGSGGGMGQGRGR